MVDTPKTTEGNGIDVGALLSKYAETQANLQGTLGELTGYVKAGQAAEQESVKATQAEGEAEVDKNTLTIGAKMKLKRDNAEAAALLGTNPDAANYVLRAASDSVLAGFSDLIKSGDEIRRKSSIGFFDDPLGYVGAQLSLPGEVETFNMKEATVNTTLSVIKELQERTTAQFAENAQIDAVESEQYLDATNRALAAKFTQQAAETKFKLAQFGISGLSVRTSITESSFRNLVDINSAIVGQQHLALGWEGLDVAKKQLAVSERQATVAERQAATGEGHLVLSQKADVRAQKSLDLEFEKFIFQKSTVATSEEMEAQRLILQKRAAAVADEHVLIAKQQYELEQKRFAETQFKNDFERNQAIDQLALSKANYELAVKNSSQGADFTRQRLGMEREQMTAQAARDSLEKEYKTLIMEEHKGNDKAKELLQAKLDNVMIVFGMSKLTVDGFKLMSGKMRDTIEAGLMDPNIDQGRVGFNAADSFEKSNAVNAPMTPGVNIVRRSLDDIKQRLVGNDATWSQKKAPEQNMAFQKEIETDVQREIKAIPDQGGVYSPPSLSSVLKIPAIKNTTLAVALAPLAVANQQYATKADDVLVAAADLISQNKMTPAAAAKEIATIYQSIVLDNNEQRQYNRLALPMMPNQFRANTQFGNVDLTNTAAIEAKLARATAQRENIRSGGVDPYAPIGIR